MRRHRLRGRVAVHALEVALQFYFRAHPLYEYNHPRSFLNTLGSGSKLWILFLHPSLADFCYKHLRRGPRVLV